jgi:hypothetical protein
MPYQGREQISYSFSAKLDAGTLYPLIRVTQKGEVSLTPSSVSDLKTAEKIDCDFDFDHDMTPGINSERNFDNGYNVGGDQRRPPSRLSSPQGTGS